MNLAAYVGKRVLFLPLGLLAVMVLSFLLVNILPGNPVGIITGPAASVEQLDETTRRLGLDQPLLQRFQTYFSALVGGDLGNSFYTNRPILDEILRFLPATLELVILSLIFAAVLGISLGAVGAYYKGRTADSVSRFTVTVFQAIPDFFLGLLLIYFLFFQFGLLPAPVGQLGILDSAPPRVTGAYLIDSLIAGDTAIFWSAAAHAVLPVLTLGIYYSSYFARTTHSALSASLESKQVEFARACGLHETKVLGYAFRQARTPILTYGGILLAALLGGAAIVETVFSWNGFGSWAIESILKLDLPAVQGFILFSGMGTLIVFTILDIVVAILDPRVRYD